jgi:hypothetical protein
MITRFISLFIKINIHCLNFSGASNVISGSLGELCLADLTVVQNDHQRHWFADSISSISERISQLYFHQWFSRKSFVKMFSF